MNIKKITFIILMAIALLICGVTVSNGAYSAGDKTVESGGSFSITVTSDTALEAYNLDLSSYSGLTFNGASKSEEGAIIEIGGGSIAYVNVSGSTKTLGTYSFKAPEVSKDTTYTVKFMVDQEKSVTSTITVKAPKQEQPPVDNNSGTTGNQGGNTTEKPSDNQEQNPGTNTQTPPSSNNTPAPKPTKSSNANLGNLGIRPNDFTGFKPSVTSYNVSVPNEVTTIEVYAQKAKNENAQTITGTGTKSLAEGSNVFSIEVTAEDGTKKTYQITVLRLAKEEETTPEIENTPEVEVALASLEIENVTLNEAFNPETFEYTAIANEKAEKVIVKATANVENANIAITGVEEYETGENIIRVTVTSADGKNSKIYVIKVNKEEQVVAEVKDEENTVTTMSESVSQNDNKKTKGINTEKLLFCIGLAVIAILGIIFAIIWYRKDKDNTDSELSEPMNFATNFSAKEEGKDIKIKSDNQDNTDQDVGEGKRNKGRHF